MNEPDIDLIVVTVHIDPQSANLDQIYYEIRKYHKETPLLIFSGHRLVGFQIIIVTQLKC